MRKISKRESYKNSWKELAVRNLSGNFTKRYLSFWSDTKVAWLRGVENEVILLVQEVLDERGH